MNAHDTLIDTVRTILHRLTDERAWAYPESIAKFIRSFDGDTWGRMPHDDQLHRHSLLQGLLGTRGPYDKWGDNDRSLRDAQKHCHHYLRQQINCT